MLRPFAFLAVGMLAGLALGYVLAPRGGAESQPPAARDAAAWPAPLQVVRERAPASRSRTQEALAALPEAPLPPVECAAWVTRADLWRQRSAELAQELAIERHFRQQREGTALAAPGDLPPRFGQEQLRQAVQAALDALGGGGTVTSIDCTEYPCVVYGEIPGEQDIEALRHSSAFAAYSEDHRDLFSWTMGNRHTPEDPPRRFFGIALHPSQDSRAPEIRRRLEYRTREMWEAYRP